MIERFLLRLRHEIEFMMKPNIPVSSTGNLQVGRHRRVQSDSNISAISSNSQHEAIQEAIKASHWFSTNLPPATDLQPDLQPEDVEGTEVP